MIICRSKSQQEIDTQIDKLADAFLKEECSGEIPELERDGGQYYEGLGDVLPANAKMDHPHSKMSDRDGGKKRNVPKRGEGGSKSIGS